MGWVMWIVLGFIAGVLAKLLLPGKDPGGYTLAATVGTVGALIGGFVATGLGFGDVTGWNLPSTLIAVLGSMLLLMIYRLVIRGPSVPR